MSIGQVTISAADWLASRVSDRMALVVAGQQASLADQRGGKSVPPVEDNARAQMDKRERERAVLAARDSYMRVAAKIKSRLANRVDPDLSASALAEKTAEKRDAVIESVKDSPGLLTAILASERTETRETLEQQSQPSETGDRPDGLIVPGRAHAQEEQEDRPPRADREPAFETGLWDDLFAASERREDSGPQ